jgi:glycine/D-amino acid oxidase-like deaminating enzyme
VSPPRAAGNQLSIHLDAVFRAIQHIEDIRSDLEQLSKSAQGERRPQLGANPVGQAIADKSAGRLNGIDSLATAVDLLRQQIDHATEALRATVQDYSAMDHL